MSELNIVIVEDDEHDYEFLSCVLEEFEIPFKKTWLQDGEEVLKYLEKMEIRGKQDSMKNVFF